MLHKTHFWEIIIWEKKSSSFMGCTNQSAFPSYFVCFDKGCHVHPFPITYRLCSPSRLSASIVRLLARSPRLPPLPPFRLATSSPRRLAPQRLPAPNKILSTIPGLHGLTFATLSFPRVAQLAPWRWSTTLFNLLIENKFLPQAVRRQKLPAALETITWHHFKPPFSPAAAPQIHLKNFLPKN